MKPKYTRSDEDEYSRSFEGQEQGYKVEITFTQPLKEQDPFEWVSEAIEEGHFKYKTNRIYATEVTPIDIESAEYKWLKDASTNK